MEKEKITIKTILEILGTPQEHVEKALKAVIQKIQERKELHLLNHETYPVKKLDDKPFWTGFIDAELQVDTTDALLNFCFDFMPSSVEITHPATLNLQSFQLNRLYNDTLARLHLYDMYVKNSYAENKLLKKQLENTKPLKN